MGRRRGGCWWRRSSPARRGAVAMPSGEPAAVPRASSGAAPPRRPRPWPVRRGWAGRPTMKRQRENARRSTPRRASAGHDVPRRRARRMPGVRWAAAGPRGSRGPTRGCRNHASPAARTPRRARRGRRAPGGAAAAGSGVASSLPVSLRASPSQDALAGTCWPCPAGVSGLGSDTPGGIVRAMKSSCGREAARAPRVADASARHAQRAAR